MVEEKIVSTLKGHGKKINSVVYHPSKVVCHRIFEMKYIDYKAIIFFLSESITLNLFLIMFFINYFV